VTAEIDADWVQDGIRYSATLHVFYLLALLQELRVRCSIGTNARPPAESLIRRFIEDLAQNGVE
jgi:hypothetical protein